MDYLIGISIITIVGFFHFKYLVPARKKVREGIEDLQKKLENR